MKRLDWFLIGMIAAVALAWLMPEPGARGGVLHPELLTKAGVALIFYLHGLTLSFGSLKAGAFRWPLHLVVQGCTFLFFPLIGLLMLSVAGERMDADLRLGFFYLCALPSTVSSSVALTAAARGNVAAAVFNATLSSLLGVLLTPLWVGVVVQQSGEALPLGEVILDLVIWLVMPLVAGQLSRPRLGGWAERRRRLVHIIDRGTILLLVYTSFCDSVKWNVWSGHGVLTVPLTLAGCAALFYAVFWTLTIVCNQLGFTSRDRIAAVFCGSKKTLASGVPMAQLIFGAHPGMGLILLPIMIYHPLQLVICGVLAQKWARREQLEQLTIQ